jgi:GNAT superfamily N-acetyltransferase
MERAFRKVLHGPYAQHERGFLRLLTRQPHPFGNFAFISDLNDVDTTTRAIEPLCSCGAPAAALYPGNPTANVADQLHAHGFELHEPMPAMAVDIDRLAPTQLPPDCELVRIRVSADAQPWTQAFADGYELPYPVAEAFSPVGVEGNPPADAAAFEVNPSTDAAVQFFAIHKEGRFVSTSMLFLDNGLAGVYCVATLPQERGKGLGAHATAAPLRVAYELGYRVGVLQSSTAGYKVYQHLGFTDFGAVPIYLRLGGNS